MKTRLALSILFSLIALPALGQLSDADLNKIRLIVKDEVKSEITASEKRMKEYIDLKIENVNSQIKKNSLWNVIMNKLCFGDNLEILREMSGE